MDKILPKQILPYLRSGKRYRQRPAILTLAVAGVGLFVYHSSLKRGQTLTEVGNKSPLADGIMYVLIVAL